MHIAPGMRIRKELDQHIRILPQEKTGSGIRIRLRLRDEYRSIIEKDQKVALHNRIRLLKKAP